MIATDCALFKFWIQLELHESKTSCSYSGGVCRFWIQLELHESKTGKVK